MKLCSIALIFALIGSAVSENNVAPTDEQVISLIDRLDSEESLPIFGGLSLEKVDNLDEVSSRSSESLTDRLIRYLRSHKVNFEISEARSSVGGKTKPVIVKKIKSTLKRLSILVTL
jgi:hypothetical protein